MHIGARFASILFDDISIYENPIIQLNPDQVICIYFVVD